MILDNTQIRVLSQNTLPTNFLALSSFMALSINKIDYAIDIDSWMNFLPIAFSGNARAASFILSLNVLCRSHPFDNDESLTYYGYA
jgi:hypothetical protein